MAPSGRSRQPAERSNASNHATSTAPALLVLDEPDSELRRLDAPRALRRDHAAAGRACLLASHDAALIDPLGARIHPLA